MARKTERQCMAESIIDTNGGQAYFNFGEIARIIGCGIHTVPQMLYDAGITVKKVGPSKRVSAIDLAELMADGRINSVD